MTTLQKIIVTLALVFIVIGAIMYILSAGNDTQMKAAKGTISAALIGMAIGLAAPSFLKEIYIILSPTGTMSPELASASTLSEIALRVLNFLLSVVGILAMIMLLIGSLMYLTAAGDEKRAEEGKKIFKYSVTGIAIAFAALVIVKQIASFFG
jgi:glucose uptake protein GlcU